MPLHVFDYLDAPANYPSAGMCVVFGDEPFLKRLALSQLRLAILGDESDDVPFTVISGEKAEWRDVLDELSTVALFGGGRARLVRIDEADSFVTANRSRLEDYAAAPRDRSVLVLDVSKWGSNTRLYKMLDKHGLQVECSAPVKLRGRSAAVDEPRIAKWLTGWSRKHHDAVLEPLAAELLLDLVGPAFGLLDQELAKLALFAGLGGTITPAMVRDVVGGWRTKTTWELIDAAVEGNAAEALGQLGRLLESGEHPTALFGSISWSLRRFAAATRIVERLEKAGKKPRLSDALEQAGFRRWPAGALENAERQLKKLGRQRARQLYRWLLDADLALKGSHSSPSRARFLLEQLILRMSSSLAPDRRQAHAVRAS